MIANGLLDHPRRLESMLRFLPHAVDVWCPLLRSSELPRNAVRGVELAGRRIAVFRDDAGDVGAVLDRCPHRGVELSLGRVCDRTLQCAYHGWRVDRSGAAVIPRGEGHYDRGPGIEAFEVRDRNAVVWIFLGERAKAATTPLPDLSPYGEGAGVEILVSKEVRAHWTLVLDNGLDLFHYQLHRDVPIFFGTRSLEEYGSDGDTFHVHYKALMSDPWGRRRVGDLRIQARDSLFTLDLNGFPLIHSVSTPRSADGRRLTLWWFIACPASGIVRVVHRAILPFVRRLISRGFDQDVMILESEQRAFDMGLRVQNELNPVVIAAHDHYAARIAQFARARIGDVSSRILEDAGALLDEAKSGSRAIMLYRDGEFALIDPARLPALLAGGRRIRIARYANVVAVCPEGPDGLTAVIT